MDRSYRKELIKRDDLKSLRKFCNLIKKIQMKDLDVCIGVSGEEGVGKSFLGIWIMIMLDKRFKFLRNMILMPTEDEVKKKIMELPRYSPISLDEAMKVLYKRGWQGKERKMLNILFSMVRKRNLTFLLTLPNFWDLDSYFVQHRIRMWIHVVSRGHALVFVKDDNIFIDDRWHRKDNMKLINRYTKGRILINKDLMGEALKRSKNFAFEITFPDLPEDIKEVYNGLAEQYFKEYNEFSDNSGEEDKVKIFRAKIENACEILIRKGWKKKAVATLFNMSMSTLDHTLKSRNAMPMKLQKETQMNIDEALNKLVATEESLHKKEVIDEKPMPSEIIADIPKEQRDILKEVFG